MAQMTTRAQTAVPTDEKLYRVALREALTEEMEIGRASCRERVCVPV